jgi:hypothetical protein
MILRRVIEHFRRQEWTAIAIDFLIVVIGVFFGMQVNNWNEDRKDRVRETAYLTRIKDNLEGDMEGLAQRKRYWAEIGAEANAAARYAETGELLDGSTWKTARAFFQASHIWFFTSNNTAFAEMTGAGDIALIRSESLRISLSDYYSDTSRLVRSVAYSTMPEYRAAVRGATPSALADYMLANCHTAGVINQRFLDCAAPVSEAEAERVLAGYVATPLLVDKLRFWRLTAGQAARGSDPDLVEAANLVAAIDTELTK